MSKLRHVFDRAGRLARIAIARRRGIRYFPPNYVYLDRLGAPSTVIDVGCGDDPDFSLRMIDLYGLKAFGVDPTRKHAPALRAISNSTGGGRFVHVPLAVTARDGEIMFNESAENVSGSVLADHANIRHDHVISYPVESVGLRSLLARLGLAKADYLKLDLEGAEYELLDRPDPETMLKFDQIFVEFHHHCLERFDKEDTKRIVARVEACGFEAFSIDRHNYLFLNRRSFECGSRKT